MGNSFVHLRAHSSSSIGDGLIPAGKSIKSDRSTLAEMAAKDGQSAIALTDSHVMSSAIDFFKDAKSNAVKPITGVSITIDEDVTSGDSDDSGKTSDIVLLASTEKGYKTILSLVSFSYTDGMVKGVPKVKQSYLQGIDLEGVIMLSGDMSTGSLAKMHKENSGKVDAVRTVDFYKGLFGQRYYIEVQRYNQEDETKQTNFLVSLADHTNVPLVATHPIQFNDRSDFFAHEARCCITGKEVISEPGRTPKFTEEQYFKTVSEMLDLFKDLPDALENSVEISKMCSNNIELGHNFLPDFDTGDATQDEFLKSAVYAGIQAKLKNTYDHNISKSTLETYKKRVDHELGIIKDMGFPGYFLIVADFIDWAKENDILVGPGRGSGVGSLVAYSLGITELDPIEHGLLFERFLNPERVSMPDIDVDFEMKQRNVVIQHIIDKYGSDNVAQIATTGKLGGRAALNGVGRAFGVSPRTMGTLSSLIPKKPVGATVKDALYGNESIGLPQVAKLWQKYNSAGEVRSIVDTAMSIEGTPVNVGLHASGLLIAPKQIKNFSPLYYDPSSSGVSKLKSQYDGTAIEDVGLVKFDFLGLKTLDIMKDAMSNINKRPEFKDKKMTLEDIPSNDQDTYNSISRGDTVTIFQLESDGMQKMLREAKPSKFEDVVALVSLYRPGPMKLIPSYIARKRGTEEITYPDDRLEGVLKETFGIIVYQEQVMQIAQIIGGYSLGKADLLRRAMGKKKHAEMKKHRKMFLAGATKNGIAEDRANSIFDTMETFASYGFNKSHAAAYALTAVRTAWLKTHYPIEWFVANMNYQAKDKEHDELEKVVIDARQHGFEIVPPDITNPTESFSIRGKTIAYGLSGLKGVSEAAVRSIAREHKQNGPFKDFVSFFERVPRTYSGKRVADALVKAGAFDAIEPNRASLAGTVKDAVKYAGKYVKRKASGGPLIPERDLPDVKRAARKRKVKKPLPLERPELYKCDNWSEATRLANEHAVSGFYITGHPFDRHSRDLGGLASAVPLKDVRKYVPEAHPDRYLVAGIVSDLFVKERDDGSKWARATIDDGDHSISLMLWANIYDGNEGWIKKGDFLAAIVGVGYDKRDGMSVQLNVKDVVRKETILKDTITGVSILMDGDNESLQVLGQMMNENNDLDVSVSRIPVQIALRDKADPGQVFSGTLPVKAAPTPEFIAKLTDRYGNENVKRVCTNTFSTAYKKRRSYS